MKLAHLPKYFLVFGMALVATACSTDHNVLVTVGGSVTGLNGSVVLSDNDNDSLTITTDRTFTFAIPITEGLPYAVTVKTQPSGQLCVVSNGSGTAIVGNTSNIKVACSTPAHSVATTVSGLTGTVVLLNNRGNALTIAGDGNFKFSTTVAEGSPYAVTVRTQPVGESCAVSNGSGTMGSADVTDVTVTCSAILHTTGGAISGLTGTVVLKNNGGDAQTISTDGVFTFQNPLAEGSAYAVTVQTQPVGQTCSVTQGTGVMGTGNVTTVAVVCSANAYLTGGTVSGLIGTVVLQNNGTDNQTIGSNGAFVFTTPVAYGSPYAVTVLTQPATQTCTVNNGSGTMGTANISNVTLICSTNSYFVGGTVSGLNGTVLLQNDGADNLSIGSNGAFTFSTPVAEGSSYNVTVLVQPSTQTCTVNNSVGTLGGTNVTNISVTCVTNNTTLVVAVNGIIAVNGPAASFTVTNTGPASASNVSAILPGGWTAVTQDASNCTTIAPSNSCTLSFTSTAPYVAQAGIVISGDNITSPPTTALAFSIDDYLVYAVTGSTAQVMASSDASSGMAWSSPSNNVPGITETSAAPPCNGASDGACNTTQIEVYYGSPTSSAAGLCDGITSDNSGTVAVGTWYLPAICEMGEAGGAAACPSGLANINTNLVQLGFGNINNDSLYWSSTEAASDPAVSAWLEDFDSTSGSTQGLAAKASSLQIRCVRTFSY